MTLTNESVKAICKAHNDRINKWIHENIPETIPMSKWLYYASLIEQQDFYTKGHRLLVALRKRGFDVKMNMQFNELVF